MRHPRIKSRERRAWNCIEYVIHHPLQKEGVRSRCVDCGEIVIKIDGASSRVPTWVILFTLKEWP